jgi:ribose-phosphate pyrophosphokinase
VLRQIDALYERGAEGKAYFSVTHPILLPSALEILEHDDRIEKLVVTNTLPVPSEKRHPKVEVLSIASLLADIIQDIHQGISISAKLVHA